MVFENRSRSADADTVGGLLAQAHRLGIETRYVDGRGQERTADPDAVRCVLEALSKDLAAQTGAPADAISATPAFSGTFDRVWGISVQLYGVRSARNWGHGDFGDLHRLIELAAEHGAAAVGLNPLHALFGDAPERASPYSPNSRLFLNPLYIDVEKAPGFPGVAAAGLNAALARVRQSEFVDYAGVAAAKLEGLQLAFEGFRNSPPDDAHDAFEHFRRERTPLLTRFACFEYLRRQYTAPWWQWPEQWCRPDDAALAQLRARHTDAIAFF